MKINFKQSMNITITANDQGASGSEMDITVEKGSSISLNQTPSAVIEGNKVIIDLLNGYEIIMNCEDYENSVIFSKDR